MANIKDLTGQRFGRLVAMERTADHKGHCFLWRCQCDCGKEAQVRTYFLTHGIARSCGCLQEESRRVDITGQRFGRLVAIRPIGKRGKGFAWLCRCDCGQTREATAAQLLEGIVRSCGCLHVETARKQAATGIWRGNIQDGTNIKLIQSDKTYRNNTSGVKGVNWHKGQGMWVARIQFQGVSHTLGYFADINEAADARKKAEQRYFGEYLESQKED